MKVHAFVAILICPFITDVFGIFFFSLLLGGKKGAFNEQFDDAPVLLRIHRGKPQDCSGKSKNSNSSFSRDTMRQNASQTRRHEKIKISISYPSSEQLPPSPTSSMNSGRLHLISFSGASGGGEQRGGSFYNSSSSGSKAAKGMLHSNSHENDCLSREMSTHARKKMGKRNIKVQVKKFRTETKAAKTLGIIVGAFIFCWCPFFTVYVVRAFCDHCIEDLLFSILFWLGYCNSAINPLIYALFSNDFRIAFKQILFCTKQTDKSIRVLIESTAANIPFFKAKLAQNITPPTYHRSTDDEENENDFATFRWHSFSTSMGTSNASVASFGGEHRSRSSVFYPEDAAAAGTSIECATYNSNCLSTLLMRNASTRSGNTTTGKTPFGGPITNL